MIIIDVREQGEFEEVSIADSILCPLSRLNEMAPAVLNKIPAGDVVIMCRSGARAQRAMLELSKISSNHRFSVYPGGILKWQSEGKNVVRIQKQSSTISPLRQAHIVGSSLIIIAFILGHYQNENWHYLALLPALGMALMGYLGFCPMVYFLERMPWNKK